VELSKLVIIDAVWTEDSDALMFGASFAIRFLKTPKGFCDTSKVRVYRSTEILEKHPMFDRAGLVLYAVLSGGDYDISGLEKCGPLRVVGAAKAGLARRLCDADMSDRGDRFHGWRDELAKHFKDDMKVPENFPNPQHVKAYNRPRVSPEHVLRQLPHGWERPFPMADLYIFLGRKLNFWIEEYIEFVIPIQLVRSLANTGPGQEASNAGYDLRLTGAVGSLQSEITFTLSAVMVLDEDSWKAELTCKTEGPSEHDPYTPLPTVTCSEILTCFIRHGFPEALSKALPRRKSSSKSTGQSKKSTPKATSKHQNSMALLRDQTGSQDETPPLKATGAKRRGRPPKTSLQWELPKKAPITGQDFQLKWLSESEKKRKRNAEISVAQQPMKKMKPSRPAARVVSLLSDDEVDTLAPVSPNKIIEAVRTVKSTGRRNSPSRRLISSSSVIDEDPLRPFTIPSPLVDEDEVFDASSWPDVEENFIYP
jgi:Holliday junction resolvase YEN1